MSRIGNKPVEMPKAVELSVEGGRFHVKGPKGALVEIGLGRLVCSVHLLVAVPTATTSPWERQLN